MATLTKIVHKLFSDEPITADDYYFHRESPGLSPASRAGICDPRRPSASPPGIGLLSSRTPKRFSILRDKNIPRQLPSAIDQVVEFFTRRREQAVLVLSEEHFGGMSGKTRFRVLTM